MVVCFKNLNPIEALIVSIWFLVGVRGAVQNDTWWHLAAGRRILQDRTFLTVDPFSWVLSGGAYWPHHEWLSDVVMYLLFSIGGISLLHVAVGIVFALVPVIAIQLARSSAKHRNTGGTSALVLLLVLPWIATGASIRPHIVTMLLLLITVWILSARRFQFLAPIFFMWAQLHGGVCLGGLIVGGAIVASFVTRDRDRYRSLWWGVISGVAVAVNPLSLDIYIHPFRSTAITRTLPIQEWLPPLTLGWQGYYLAALLALFMLVIWVARRRLSEWEVVVQLSSFLVVLPVMLLHARVVSLALPIAAAFVVTILGNRDEATRVHALRASPIYSLVLLVVSMAIYSVVQLRETSPENPISQQGIEVINSSPQRLFNTYDTGGFLIWFTPLQKVFIDSRQDPYPAKLLQEAIYVQTSGDYEQFFGNFDIRTAVVERHFQLHRKLVEDGWRVKYSGPFFDVLITPSAH